MQLQLLLHSLLLHSLLRSLLCAACRVQHENASSRPVVPRHSKGQELRRQQLSREWELERRNIVDIRGKLRFNDKFVPVIGGRFRGSPLSDSNSTFLEKRTELFDYGCYPGVEYRIKEMGLRGIDGTCTRLDTLEGLDPGDYASVLLRIRPAYPLIRELERAWPVEVPMSRIPNMLSRGSYNVVTVVASVLSSLSLLAAAYATSSLLTLSVINSRSMEPAIRPKDIILVEKVSPFIKTKLMAYEDAAPRYAPGDIVFFTPPEAMREYIRRNSLPPVGDSTLIVKRVAQSVVGDKKERNCVRALGDNDKYSLDSRFWGCLPADNVVGRPLLRLLPLERFGVIK